MIKVLVIDDSAVMRAFLGRVVGAQPDMELAGVASDPLLAIERIRRAPPDVITLDVEMPRMNGLEFLRKLMAVRPIPVVMVSSLTRQGAEATLRALELGAVDFFPKPGSFEALDAVGPEIAEKIRAAAQAKVGRHGWVAGGGNPAPLRPVRPVLAGARPASGSIIGIGASTGGVEALRHILTGLPATMPPIVIAQHMLPGFTETFARRLDAICALDVREARDGDVACEGGVYVAPGGRHLLVQRSAGAWRLRLSDAPPVNRHRPSVDTLFRSLAQAAGPRCIALILTGMGADGAEAMLALRAAGATTLAQDEASSVVFGMPRQAIALGAAQEVVGLEQVAGRLLALSAA
ncbi:chemotaxis response regulator protein-glutamate methylesterase [Ramlibacter tataouinensis]|uniref:protein-glutamate methylesterase/protein-glutamine glutaminase n=1 Tax=Ramlibacter tataouinensis TaxID=94132 RepID=UPI0022F3A5E4|nr:chemotaxis response regulator protein-glutamate methylesterase [Ramlibacter tataouinensis]WBY02456.1 chemotaxis response regulator protein-glutamate methylesterase [Ramlibacter tataouinensis]